MNRPTGIHQRLLSAMLCAALWAACPGADPTKDGGDTAADGSGGARTALLGVRAQAYLVTGPRRWEVSLAALSEPSSGDPLGEAMVIPADTFGIPWSEFATTSRGYLPANWLAKAQATAQLARDAGRPVALALSPLNEDWDNLAPLASDGVDGEVHLEENWLGDFCHDPSQDADPYKWRDAYARYVVWMVKLFEPRWVFLGQRLNRYEERCGGASPGGYAAYAGYVAAADGQLKQDVTDPPITVVTVDVEDLYGFPKKPSRCDGLDPWSCLEERKPLLDGLVADRLGLESYPASALPYLAGGVPADWLDRVAAIRPDLPSLVAGAGLPAVEVLKAKGRGCSVLLESDEELQRGFLEQLLATAESRAMELLVWSSPIDQLPAELVAACQCTGDQTICDHLGQLGSNADQIRLRLVEGFYATDGTARLAAAVWQAALASAR